MPLATRAQSCLPTSNIHDCVDVHVDSQSQAVTQPVTMTESLESVSHSPTVAVPAGSCMMVVQIV
jgi:hypothetical protein